MTQYRDLVQQRKEEIQKERDGREIYQLLWDKNGSHTYYMNGKIVSEKDGKTTITYQKSRLDFN
jgi:hypothetical protein